MNSLFYINSILLGIGLAMDAFSVSLVNGLNEPKMTIFKKTIITITFGFFQFLMPIIGYFFLKYLTDYFNILNNIIPYLSLILLLFLGIKMILESKNSKDNKIEKLNLKVLILQAIATSIDALSVGLTISNLNLNEVILESIIIGVITSIICYIGLLIGKKFGTKYSKYASIIGGLILIGIGLEIFIKGVFIK